ncbi:hypothetical protein CAPTEDRAFT_198760 [Capitella teleta]|uniref:VWFD domain-containing protein n=1 Tax=Capitella teleta TaxID=283909 RepID=R7V754_CAPTE|nr:hypothetical protein CAPTEDRAFT_198760 [Capitella teleta]|eukprot:ELU14668.1 hypothetical protein CAPTEDRAFT_198760 [Capitella teleta]
MHDNYAAVLSMCFICGVPIMATGECVCRGDPHCFAFDANRFNQQHDLHTSNVCAYVMATDRCGGKGTYAISALLELVKDISSVKSFVGGIGVHYSNPRKDGEQQIMMMPGPQIFFGAEMFTEFPKRIDDHLFEMVPAVFVHPKDFSKGVTEVMSYTLPNGVNIQYDGIKGVKINNDALAPGTPRCGLCGNDDGVYDDQDFLMGNNVNGIKCKGLPADGAALTVTTNKQHFVNSWFLHTTTHACNEICSPTTPFIRTLSFCHLPTSVLEFMTLIDNIFINDPTQDAQEAFTFNDSGNI